eukprot:gene7150-7903_t
MTTMITSIISMGTTVSKKISAQQEQFMFRKTSTHKGSGDSEPAIRSQVTQDMFAEDSTTEKEIDHEFRKKYRMERFLGHGASADVYIVKDKVTQELLACKKVEIRQFDPDLPSAVEIEAALQTVTATPTALAANRKKMMDRYAREQRRIAAYAKTIPPVQPVTPCPSVDCLTEMR